MTPTSRVVFSISIPCGFLREDEHPHRRVATVNCVDQLSSKLTEPLGTAELSGIICIVELVRCPIRITIAVTV